MRAWGKEKQEAKYALQCRFCSWTEPSASLLESHCLDEHPVDFLIAQGSTSKPLTSTSTHHLTGSQPLGGSSLEKNRRTCPSGSTDKVEVPVKFKVSSWNHGAALEDYSPPSRKQKDSKKPGSSESRTQERESSSQWRPRLSRSPEEKVQRKSIPDTLLKVNGQIRERKFSASRALPCDQVPMDNRLLDAGQRELMVLDEAAIRCTHNERLCRSFPHCLGRNCTFRHPLCLSTGNWESGCLERNACAFEHQRFEKVSFLLHFYTFSRVIQRLDLDLVAVSEVEINLRHATSVRIDWELRSCRRCFDSARI